jgi:hypothetical protein
VGASGGIYIALYTIWYLFAKMKYKDIASDVLIMIYLYMFIGLYICAAGAISVQSSYYFVRYMYKDLRAE